MIVHGVTCSFAASAWHAEAGLPCGLLADPAARVFAERAPVAETAYAGEQVIARISIGNG